MISSTQLEAFYERYQREGVPNDLSMQAFCSMYNVPYNCFERHVRQRAKFSNIQPVRITGIPELEDPASSLQTKESHVEHTTPVISDDTFPEDNVRIPVTIKMSNGFQIHRSNIDYRTLQDSQFVTDRTTATLPATAHTP